MLCEFPRVLFSAHNLERAALSNLESAEARNLSPCQIKIRSEMNVDQNGDNFADLQDC